MENRRHSILMALQAGMKLHVSPAGAYTLVEGLQANGKNRPSVPVDPDVVTAMLAENLDKGHRCSRQPSHPVVPHSPRGLRAPSDMTP